MERALLPGREGTWQQRAQILLRARDGFIDVPVEYNVDLRRAAVGLEPIRATVRRAPVNAHLNLTAHERIADVPGEELDVEATMIELMRAVSDGVDAFEVKTKPVAAQVTLADLDAVDVTKEVASFETKFAVWGVGRARGTNIALAAKTIDGLVLMPGQAFSFNEVVGRRTLERGYVWAPVIVGDELRPGVGGGICQVASTLYASALFGAMQITERWAHGRPSSYTRMGLDATVSYPSKDLRFVNSLPYPVILHVFVPKTGLVRAEVLRRNAGGQGRVSLRRSAHGRVRPAHHGQALVRAWSRRPQAEGHSRLLRRVHGRDRLRQRARGQAVLLLRVSSDSGDLLGSAWNR